MKEPRELDVDSCPELLPRGVIGRVAVCGPDGPHLVPVNYAVHDDSVVFRTAAYSQLGSLARLRGQRLAFEVDHVDLERQRGWSVVAAGPAEIVQDPEELSEIQTLWDPSPLAAGSRNLYVRLRWDSLTGRQVGDGWTPADEPPVHRRL